MRLNKKTNNKGFTLLEILVVVSIIGILIVLGAAAFTTAQRKGRDARRSGDLKAMQNAFEQYYAESSSSYANNCATMASSFPGGIRPLDPKTGLDYACTSSLTTGIYCVCALLDDEGSGNSGASCAYASGGDYFCVSNLQ